MKFTMSDLNLDRQAEMTKAEAKKVLYLSMKKMEQLAKIRAPVDTGILRRSINLTPKFEGAELYTLADGTEYGVHVEFGTPSMIQAHGEHDPKNPVTDWEAKRKRGGGAGQTLPFMRPAKLEVEFIWVKHYWNKVFNQRN